MHTYLSAVIVPHPLSVKRHLTDEQTNGQTPGVEFGAF